MHYSSEIAQSMTTANVCAVTWQVVENATSEIPLDLCHDLRTFPPTQVGTAEVAGI